MMFPCERCIFVAQSYNALIEHGIKAHGDKLTDPGNEFSSPGAKKLADLMAWIRRAPDANLKTGEGKLLLDEIDHQTRRADEAEDVVATLWVHLHRLDPVLTHELWEENPMIKEVTTRAQS